MSYNRAEKLSHTQEVDVESEIGRLSVFSIVLYMYELM
jgi:hypothetical protein